MLFGRFVLLCQGNRCLWPDPPGLFVRVSLKRLSVEDVFKEVFPFFVFIAIKFCKLPEKFFLFF